MPPRARAEQRLPPAPAPAAAERAERAEGAGADDARRGARGALGAWQPELAVGVAPPREDAVGRRGRLERDDVRAVAARERDDPQPVERRLAARARLRAERLQPEASRGALAPRVQVAPRAERQHVRAARRELQQVAVAQLRELGRQRHGRAAARRLPPKVDAALLRLGEGLVAERAPHSADGARRERPAHPQGTAHRGAAVAELAALALSQAEELAVLDEHERVRTAARHADERRVDALPRTPDRRGRELRPCRHATAEHRASAAAEESAGAANEDRVRGTTAERHDLAGQRLDELRPVERILQHAKAELALAATAPGKDLAVSGKRQRVRLAACQQLHVDCEPQPLPRRRTWRPRVHLAIVGQRKRCVGGARESAARLRPALRWARQAVAGIAPLQEDVAGRRRHAEASAHTDGAQELRAERQHPARQRLVLIRRQAQRAVLVVAPHEDRVGAGLLRVHGHYTLELVGGRRGRARTQRPLHTRTCRWLSSTVMHPVCMQVPQASK